MKNLIFTATATATPAGFRVPSCDSLVFGELRHDKAGKVRDAHAAAAMGAHPGSHSWKRLRST